MTASFPCRVIRSALIAGLALGAKPALAQTVAPPPTPSERARPDFAPVGGRIGSFMLYPQVDATIIYDTNVLADDSGQRSDVVATIRPTVRIESLWQRHRIVASAYLSQSWHAKLGTEDELEGGARVAGHLDIDRDSRLDAAVSFDALAEDRSLVTATRGAAEPVRFTRTAANFGYTRQVGDLSTSAQVQATRLDFQDAAARDGRPIDEDFRDSTYYSAAARVAYRIGPGISLLGRVELDRFDYVQENVGSAGFDRDSTGMKIEAGAYFELSRLLFGELRFGYLQRSNSDPRIASVKGISFGAAITWFPTSLTSAKLTANREVEEGGSINTAGNLRSRFALVVEHELLRSLVVAAEGRAMKIEPIGPLPNSWEYGAELRATYYVNRNLRLIGRLEHFRREATPPQTGLSRNRVLLTARVVF